MSLRCPRLFPIPPLSPAFLASLLGTGWLCLVLLRALNAVAWSWWIVLSPPFVVAAGFSIGVLIVRGVDGLFWLLVRLVDGLFQLGRRWFAWRRRRSDEKEARRVREFFARGHHIQDRRDLPPHRW